VLAQSVQGDVELDFRMPDEQIAVKLDPSELEIALLNLTLNARRHAGRRQIVIALTRAQSPSAGMPANLGRRLLPWSQSPTAAPAFPDTIRERIFEPFFTTKAGRQRHRAGAEQVFASSTSRRARSRWRRRKAAARASRCFCRSATKCRRAPRPPRSRPRPRWSRHACCWWRIIRRRDRCGGLSRAVRLPVVKAISAEAAVETLTGAKDIDLVFSDIVMPGMSGLELDGWCATIIRKFPVVLASGYSDKAARAVETAFVLLEKPYSARALRPQSRRVDRETRRFDRETTGAASLSRAIERP